MPFNSFDNYPMSWKPKLQNEDRPIYLSLAEQLEMDIRSGALLPGTKLPPQRELADFLDVNISTIVRAFRLCTQNGLLSGIVGKGTFVSYDALANLRMIPQKENAACIELGPLTPSDVDCGEIIQILQEMISEPGFSNLLGYGNIGAAMWQKEAAIKLIAQAGYHTETNRLLLASGGQNAVAAILCGLFASGDRIGTDPLTYPGLKSTAKMLRIRLVPIRQKDGEISEEGLLYACKNEKIKGLYIMPDYHNPTAHIMSESCRQMLARIAIKENIMVIEDNIHSLLSEHPPKAVAAYAPDQTIYVASLSKTVLPGLRLAYIVSPEPYRAILEDALYNLNISVSPLLFELGSRMMASEKTRQLAQARREIAIQRNLLVNEILADYQILGSEECIFRWMLLPEGFTSEQFEQVALQAGVRVYGSHRFAVGAAKPRSAVRLSISTPRTIGELNDGLHILRTILRGK